MSNNNILIDGSTLVQNKINELANRLTTLSQSGEVQTRQQYMVEATNFLLSFVNDISKPIYKPIVVTSNEAPNPDDYNKQFTDILSDLKILFPELENIENIILSNFNFMVSNTNRLNAKLKSIYSKLGDYILYNQDPSEDVLFFSDSFLNLERIDFNSKLINSTQCEIDTSQGVATLPINKQAFKRIVVLTQPAINSNSNGVIGNNWETNRDFNGDIMQVLDGNPDTCFEYERVINTETDKEPLVLDLTINLGKAQIINYIRVNPNNFGTQLPIMINEIETSVDGKQYISIKDEIPLSGFESEDEENLFVLAPSTSKYAGQGIFSFNPREVKYIHLVLQQSVPYSINTTDGTKLRYAIGLRDIEISAYPYDTNGELISNSFELSSAIAKVGLITHQNPTQVSALASIEHFVSPDDGVTWYPITPSNFRNPTVVNFNTLDDGAIKTTVPVKTLRYKAIMKRNSEVFQGDIVTSKQIKQTSQLASINTTAIKLSTTAQEGSVKVFEPFLGSRNILSQKFFVGNGDGYVGSNIYTSIFQLPWTNIKPDIDKYGGSIPSCPIRVFINGQEWFNVKTLTGAGATNVFEADLIRGIIRFGNGTDGQLVPAGAKVEVMFTPERFNGKTGKLSFDTVGDKKTISVRCRTSESVEVIENIPQGTTVFKLIHQNLLSSSMNNDYTVTTSTSPGSGQYYCDKENGYIYFGSPTTISLQVKYTYQPYKILSEDEWNIVDNTVTINDNSFTTIKKTCYIGPLTQSEPNRYASLPDQCIVPGTLRFANSTIFHKEVPFIDGSFELNNYIKTTEQIPMSTVFDGIYELRLKMAPDVTTHVSFSNTTIFNRLVGDSGQIEQSGDYAIDRESSIVYFWPQQDGTDLGTITYFYKDPTKTNTGLYSVNYETGEVYTSSTLSVGTQNLIRTEYEYSWYEVSYPIARRINNSDINYDVSTQTVTIEDRELGKRLVTNSPGYYQIVFNEIIEEKTNINQLEPYFTPILKDYALKIIPESSLN